MTDSKMFWKIIKPFLSDKITSSEEITLVDTGDDQTTQVFNTFFSDIVNSLNICQYCDSDPLSDNIADPIILKV